MRATDHGGTYLRSNHDHNDDRHHQQYSFGPFRIMMDGDITDGGINIVGGVMSIRVVDIMITN